jgi:hypothetical protein
MSSDENECRICFELETVDDPFIYPCKCKGTSKYVHTSCLNSWRTINRDNDAFKRCMECRTEYDIINEFPIENSKLFYCCRKMIQSYCINYFIGSTLGLFIWIFEAYGDNYIFLRTMDGNFENDGALLKIIREDSLAPQIFYFSFALFIQNIIFYLYYVFTIKRNIHRQTLYNKKMKTHFICGIMFNMLFLVFFFSLKDQYPIILLNIISFFSITEPINSYILIKEHNNTINWLNDNNPETLRNYQVHNPILEHERFRITNTTNNVLYQSLTTDSNESDNIQSLNIVIEN